MKRLLAGGLPRIYQLSHCWRADEQGPLHQPEFMLCEWYRAFAGQDDVITDTEQIVVRVAAALARRATRSRRSARRPDPALPAHQRAAGVPPLRRCERRGRSGRPRRGSFLRAARRSRRAGARPPAAPRVPVRLPAEPGVARASLAARSQRGRAFRALRRRRGALQRLRRAHRRRRAAPPLPPRPRRTQEAPPPRLPARRTPAGRARRRHAARGRQRARRRSTDRPRPRRTGHRRRDAVSGRSERVWRTRRGGSTLGSSDGAEALAWCDPVCRPVRRGAPVPRASGACRRSTGHGGAPRAVLRLHAGGRALRFQRLPAQRLDQPRRQGRHPVEVRLQRLSRQRLDHEPARRQPGAHALPFR